MEDRIKVANIVADAATYAISENADRSAKRWGKDGRTQHFPNFDVFMRCEIEELGEFVRAVHDGIDLPALELIQAGGLIVNALRMFTDEEILVALAEEQKRHPE